MKDRINQLVAEGGMSQWEIARKVAKEFGIESADKVRWHVRKATKKHKALELECEKVGIDVSDVTSYWHKGKHFSINVKPSESIDIEKVILNILEDNYLKPKVKIEIPEVETFDRLIFTDTHIGMDASRKGLAMYAEEWGKDMLLNRIDIMIQKTLENKKSDVIYIDELGDYLDGFNGLTTRGGHKLPQNMTNEEVFDLGLKCKLKLAEELSKHYKYVIFNNVNNDNHSSSFSYTVNSAFKHIVDVKYDNVEVHNHLKFMSHYTVGDHCFILTHGKDDRHMKYGFKPILDAKQVYKIDQFLKNEGIYRKAKYIEISKGDSHQCLFDMCTSDDFHYFNYAAFSPSSEWVQLNFTKGRSGFTLQTVDKYSPNKSIFPYFFN